MVTVSLATSQGAAANPDSEEQQQRLREAAEGLRMATNAAAQNAIKKKLVQRLEVRLGNRQCLSDSWAWSLNHCRHSRAI